MIKEELIKSIIERYNNKLDLLYKDINETAFKDHDIEKLWCKAMNCGSALDSLLEELGDLIND